MAFQAVVNAASIEVIYTLNNVTVENVFYAHAPLGYVLLDLQQLAGSVDGSVGAAWLNEQVVEAVYLRTEVRGLTLENDITATDNTSTGPGTDVSGALPNNVTFSIKKTSGQTGRSARGRSYWIGIPAGKLVAADENLLLTAYVSALVANLEVVRTGIQALPNWDAVLVSRFAGGVKRSVGKTFPWVGNVAVDERIDTQRTRLS